MKNYDHIKTYENILNSHIKNSKKLDQVLTFMEENFDNYKSLVEYYYSDQWKQDLEDDNQKGLIPADIKRGVLSEDAIYNLITDYSDSISRILKIIANYTNL